MLFKIKGKTPQQVQAHLEGVLNVAALLLRDGVMPTHAETTGPDPAYWWHKESERRYVILGVSNDNWIDICEVGEGYIIANYSARYDSKGRKQTTFVQAIAVFFGVDVIEVPA